MPCLFPRSTLKTRAGSFQVTGAHPVTSPTSPS